MEFAPEASVQLERDPMFLNVIECDRCQKRSENQVDSKSYVYIQWFAGDKKRKELHLCPSCGSIIAESIITPRFAKLHASNQDPFELSYQPVDEEIIYKAREDVLLEFLPNT